MDGKNIYRILILCTCCIKRQIIRP